MKTRRADFWRCLADFPPSYVRLFAKQPGGGRAAQAISDAELAISSGMTLERVRQICCSENWDAITVSEMRAFFTACHFDPTLAAHRNRVAEYYRVCTKRKTKVFQYLRNHPKWESEFLPLVRLMQTRESQKNSSSELPQSLSVATRSVA
jgi:hypothetical protein